MDTAAVPLNVTVAPVKLFDVAVIVTSVPTGPEVGVIVFAVKQVPVP